MNALITKTFLVSAAFLLASLMAMVIFAKQAEAYHYPHSIDYEVNRYSHGPYASIGGWRPDANNVVVEYSGTAGYSHRDNIIAWSEDKPTRRWGYNWYIVYDHKELNRLGHTRYARNKLTRHERAHTRGWRHGEAPRRYNQAFCRNVYANGSLGGCSRTYYYSPPKYIPR